MDSSDSYKESVPGGGGGGGYCLYRVRVRVRLSYTISQKSVLNRVINLRVLS